MAATEDGWRRLLFPSLENELRGQSKVTSDEAAVDVFAKNLEALLLAAPLGGASVIGIDPGLRTGCKCAVLDGTGKLIDHTVINLVKGDRAKDEAKATLIRLVKTHKAMSSIFKGVSYDR